MGKKVVKKWSKSGQIEVSERFFEKISLNITVTEKMMMTILLEILLPTILSFQ